MKKTTKTQSKVTRRATASKQSTPVEETVNVTVAPKKLWLILLLLVLLVLTGLFFSKKYRGLVLVGTVNGKIVTRWELEKALNDRYAKQTFDDLVGSLLLIQLAAQNQVVASPDEVGKEITATEERLGGKEALNATLERMGFSQKRFQEEMNNQVVVRKLAEKLFKAEVADDEVKKFFDENKTLFPNKKFDEVKADIRLNLKQQKLQEQFGVWFQDQRKNAVVISYL